MARSLFAKPLQVSKRCVTSIAFPDQQPHSKHLLNPLFKKSQKGDGGDGGLASGKAEDMFASAAANALAAAVHNNSTPSKAPAPLSTGRRLHGTDIAIDLDDLRPNEAVHELKVQPITLVRSDFKLEQTQLVAVSDTYICYGLKAGHIRALDRNTGGRALFKGHPTGISSMAFFSASDNLLASASKQGDIAVRRVADKAATPTDESTIEGQVLMSAQLPAAALQAAAATRNSSFAPVTLAWHPTVPQILAAGAGSSVLIYEVPTAFSGAEAPPLSEPGITYSITTAAAATNRPVAITSVAFTPTGDLLVAGDSAGGVHVWWLEGEEVSEAPLLSWQPFSDGSGIGSVRVLHQAADGSSLLLTGSDKNSSLALWALPAAALAGAQQPQQLQTVSFAGKPGSDAGSVFCHVAVQPDMQLVVLADTGRKQVYSLHYSLSSSSDSGGPAAGAAAGVAGAAFDYAAFFSVKQPILSLSTIPEASDEGAEEQQLLLYCVQTDAIQQYMLNTAMCVLPEGADTESVGEVDEDAGSTTTAAAADASTPAAVATASESGDSAAASEVPPPAKLPTPTLLAARAAAHKAGSASAADTVASPVAKAAAAAPESLASALEAAADDSSEEAAAAAVASVVAAADGSKAAPMPPMPTSTLMHSAEKAPPASGSSAPAAQQPASPTPAAAAAKAEPSAAAAAAVPAALVASGVVSAAAAAGAAGVSSSAEVAALQQQMAQLLQMQERLAAQLQAAPQATVAGVKAELGRSLKSTEASLLKQFEAALKASAKRADDERRKAAAKERQDLERMMAEQLNQVSVALNRTMTQVVADTAREQARATVNATVNAVTPAVASAVAASLQQELASAAGAGGSLQAALEHSLASSLAGPLHEALRNNFDASLIPAFERATRVMFSQVESAFTSWLADSSKAVSAAQADAASSLNSALSQLQAVVGSMRTDLADTSRSLSKLASSTASRAPADGAAAGGAAASGGSAGGAGAGGAAAAAKQDPRVEIGALLASRQMETALVKALNTASLDVLLWTCKQIDPAQVLGGASLGLSQTTLLSLVHQLSTNLSSDANSPLKLSWLAEAAPVIDPHDPVTAPHLQGVLTGVLNSLKQLVLSLPQTDPMAKKGKVTLHLFNSLLHQ